MLVDGVDLATILIAAEVAVPYDDTGPTTFGASDRAAVGRFSPAADGSRTRVSSLGSWGNAVIRPPQNIR